MRSYALCWILLVGAPASARTAETLDFLAPSAVTAGFEQQRDGDFTLYRHVIAVRQNGVPGSAPAAALPAGTRSAAPSRTTANCTIIPDTSIISGLEINAARRRLAWWPEVARAECRYGLPRGLLDALILAESGYDRQAISSAGARGLTQLMPSTAADLGVHLPDDPASNIDGGARYLRAMLTEFGSVVLGLAAYNAGPAAVSRANGTPVNGETPGYVRRVLEYWINAGDPVLQLHQTAQLLRFTLSSRN